MKMPQLTPEDVDFLIESEQSLLDDLQAFVAAIRSLPIQERMKYIKKYQRVYGNTKSEKAITQRLFNRIVDGNYSIKQISYIATAVRELVMNGAYRISNVSEETKDIIARRQHCCCAICGDKLRSDKQADHKVPRSIIGEHWGNANLQVLCQRCNSPLVKSTTVGLQPRFVTAMRNSRTL